MHCNHKEISKIQDYISFQLHMVLMLRTKKSNTEFVRTAEKNPKFKDDIRFELHMVLMLGTRIQETKKHCGMRSILCFDSIENKDMCRLMKKWRSGKIHCDQGCL